MLSLICNRASICKQSVKALMGISTEFYSDKIDIHFIDVNAKSLWPFSTFVNHVLKFYPHFACSERLRKFPIKYGDLYICDRGVRKLPVQYWHRNHHCICKNWLLIFFVSLRYEWKKRRAKMCTSFFFFFFFFHSYLKETKNKKSAVNSYNLISYHFHTKSKGKQP